MVLQPLVENAIRHGLELSAGPGFVRIAARQQNGCLILTVEDNGVGLASAASRQDYDRQGGVGLSSVRERLDSLYGGGGDLVLRERPDRGIVAEVRLPLRRIPADDSIDSTPAV